MENLKDLSEKDFDKLKDQIATEQRRREVEAAQKQEARVAAFFKVLTREVINGLAPEHGRTSCNDDKLDNGWGSRGQGYRCLRCALLEGMYGSYPTGITINLILSIHF